MSIWGIRTDGDGMTASYETADGVKEVRLDDATGSVSDGYHTFDELYRHRALLTASLFTEWADRENWRRDRGVKFGVHKSRLHSDGSKLDGYFIVMAELPTGQISYHYPDTDWDLFDIPELDRALSWDGHTSADVVDRIERYLREH